MKNVYIITTLLLSLVSFSQLSNKHWIPPLHSRDDTAIQDHYLYLSTAETVPFQVTVKTGDGTPITGSPFTISQTNPAVILIGNGQPSSMFLDQTDLNVVVSDKGLILEGSKDFYASFRMRAQNHAETLISKGKPGIGTSFRLGSTPQGGDINIRNFVASVMATQDNTTITLSDYDTNVDFVTLNGPISPDTQTFTLNKGQSVVFSGYTDNTANWTGFIGASLVANKPVAVNTGNATGGVTNNGSDFTLDQIVSATQIGTEYIFIEGNGLPEMERPLLIANEDNTEIYVNGNTTPIAILNAGDYTLIPNSYYQGANNKNIFVRSSKPVFAYQLIGGDASSPTSGLNFIPPLSCFFQNSVYIPAIDSIGNTNYSADLMVLTYSSSTITVNGNPINPATSEAVLGNTDWVTYRISGYSGNVSVVSTGPLAVGVFGASGAAGYAGYYSGFGSAPTDTDVTVCSSATKDLFESIDGNPGPNGTWAVPAGGAPLNGNIFDPAVNIPGEYIYTFTKNCNTSLTTISVKANVTVVQGGNPGTSTTKNTCINDPSFDLFTLLGTNVTTGGIWSPALASGTSLFNPAVDVSGTYTYTIPANSVCPELSSSITITNNPLPSISPITTLEQCDDNLDGDDTNGKVTFNLNTKNTEALNGQTGITVTYHLTASDAIANTGSITTYYGGNNTIHVRLTNTATGCYSVTSFEVKVNPKPVVSNTITLTQCDDDTDAITDFNLTEANGLLATQNNLTFSYYTTQTEAENNTNPITNTTVYNSANNGVVWARVTNEFGCYRTAKVNLIVSTTQVPAGFQFPLNECDEFISLSDPDFDGIDYFNLNPAITAILNLFPGNQNLTVTYYTSQANALAETNAITTLANFRNTIPHSQTIWVRIDSSLNNDCVGLGPYVTLTVNPLPNFDLPTRKILCVNPINGAGILPVDATPTTPGNYSYTWTPANTNTNPAIYNITQPGVYSVVVTNTVTGCTKQDQIQVDISSPPVAVTAILNNELFAPGLSSIQAITSGGFGNYEYSLDNIEWQNSPVFNNLENGTYTIYVRDKNECGQISSNAIRTISYPNYFTPNGDGYNDTWNIIGLTPEFEAKIYIFDRYGKLLKEINPYKTNGWDGIYNGTPMPSTDYWFRIEYKQNGETKEFRSHFSLKR
ncbi:T9SS type B sorting domain-containing protein [Flavobacterium sp.]|uniref:T9SS type B sorting domain-containing protein n=1 Tax=Flavobacterium sp. TaxID=239 RepID=UPI0037BE8B4F